MIEHNIELRELNTFGIAATARLFSRFSSDSELGELLQQAGDHELLILGGGSNVLFTKNIDAWVLKNEIRGIRVVEESDESIVVEAGAGEVWHEFVQHCVQQNWGGIENLSLIPGSVGASPMQNIGAYGVEIKDVFEYLDAMEIKTGNIRRFYGDDCAFGYRESVFKRALKNQFVITRVAYRLDKHPKVNTSYGAIEEELTQRGITSPSIQDVSQAVIAIRSSKLPNPAEIGNAGSFFKNPVVEKATYAQILTSYPNCPSYPIDELHVKVPAGWLIEQAGWKGMRRNNHGVHTKQALVLVNYGGATGSEIYQLSHDIIENVKDKFSIELEREVNIY